MKTQLKNVEDQKKEQIEDAPHFLAHRATWREFEQRAF